MSVKLKKEKLKDGRLSLYLDVYINKDKSYRKGLKMYLVPEKTKSDKDINKEVIRFAELIRNKFESNLLNNRFVKKDPKEKYNNDFLIFFESFVAQRYETGVNYTAWRGAQKHLLKFCKEKLPFEELTETWLEGFKAYLSSKVSQNTAHTYFNKIKRSIHTAFRQKLIEDNPAELVSSPKMVNTKREFLTKEELLRLQKEECRYPILKDAFLFSVLTGLRWSDIQNLKWSEVRDGDDYDYLMYTQKKTKEFERLPINSEARSLLGKRQDYNQRVFKGLKYSAWHNMAILQWMLRADIKKHITFHCARHSHATLLINNGVDIFTVSKMLGHSEVRTTQIYAKLANQSKVDALERLPKLF